MKYENDGSRIKDLQQLLNAIVEIYTPCRDQGILSVRFTNCRMGKRNVGTETLETVMRRCNHGGLAKIGTGLKKKVLDRFTRKGMKKPLLVMVVMDGKVTSIPRSFLPTT